MFFEAVAVNLAELSDDERASLVASREKVIEDFQRLMTERDFERAVSVGTRRSGRRTIGLAPVTLLTGLNSSGKSTVLQALAMLRQSNARARATSAALLRSRAGEPGG